MVHEAPQPLPLVSDCSLDADGLRAQRERYAALGRELVGLERKRGELIAVFTPDVDPDLLLETIEVERECCPFFALAYDAAERRLSIRVGDPAQDPALDALRYSLAAGR